MLSVPPRFPRLDTDPHPTLGIYSAGNLGEVAPERISVMAWSLVGDPQERACRALARRLWGRAAWCTGSHYAFVGYFACRPYHNLSGFCRLAAPVPWLRPDDVSRAYFEGAAAPELESGWRPGGWLRASILRHLVSEVGGLGGRARELEGRVLVAEQATPAGGDAALATDLARIGELLDAAWDVHVANTACLVPLHRLQQVLGERLSDCWPDVEPWVNRPGALVWDALALVGRGSTVLNRATEFLDRPFYEVAGHVSPWSGWSASFQPGRAAGPAPPARPGPDVEDAFWRMLPPVAARPFRALARLVVDTMAARELSKSLVMRALRLAGARIERLAGRRGLREQEWPLLTVRELVKGASGLRELAAARWAECEVALAVPMPDYMDLRADALPPAPPRRSRGLGVSPGVVQGMAVREAPEDHAAASPRILVRESVDAGLAPLLPRLAGVVTARGSVLSHAAILLREHGVPAVLACDAARSIAPGQLVRLDGASGEVEVLDGQP